MEKRPELRECCASAREQPVQHASTSMAAVHSSGKKRHSTICKTNVKRVRRSCPQSRKSKLNEGRSSVSLTQEVGDSEGPVCDVDLRGASSVDSFSLHVDSLPHSILLSVFKYLSLYDLLRVIALVSKRWRDMGRDPDLWRTVNLRGQNKVTDDVINLLTSYSHNVRLVDVTDSRLVTNEGIYLVAKRCTQLRELKLIRCLQLTDPAFISIAHNCPHLTTLCLDVCFALTGEAVEKISCGCHKLQVLCLNQCSKVTDAGVKAIGKGCPDLRTLSLEQCVKVSDACLPDLVAGCPQLEVLKCMKCSFTTEGLANIAQLRRLRVLELSQIASVTNESVMKIVHHCPHLESLALSLCTGITDTCVDYIARNARNLRSLHLVSCSLTDSALVSLGAHSRSIQTVDVGWCEHITAEGVTKISETCPTLLYLGLMRCDLITIAMMDQLVERFPRVKFSTMWLDCRRLIQMAKNQGFLHNLPSLRI